MLKINLKVFNLVKKYDKKIVFFSTSEVYKDNVAASENDDLIIGNPEYPRWGYSSGKLTSEFLCKSLCKKSIIIRPFNICGKYDKKGVLYQFIKNIKNNLNVIIHGDGHQTRSFCDVRDLIEFLNIINHLDFSGEIYNIGNSNNFISMHNLAKLCISLANSNVEIDYVDYKHCFSEKHRDIYNRRPNCMKMNALYVPKYNITDIIQNLL
jgi:UDP-glucose 4-epimerase